MKFIKQNRDNSVYVDNIFAISNLAKADKDPSTINATIGSFFNEDGKLLTFPIIFDSLNELTKDQIVGYAQGPQGNKDYNEALIKFVLENRVKHVRSIATTGGTGAISLAVAMCLNEGDTIYLPEIAWGNYALIAKEFNLKVVNYDPYNIDSLINKIDGKAFIVINSPCENPCGCSYSVEEWKKLFNKLKTIKEDIVVLNDAAYMDYSNNLNFKDYLDEVNNLNDNILFLLAYSCSKSFSYYGQRIGALMLINKDEELLDTLENQFSKHNRTIWSSANNGAMNNVTNILNNHLEEYRKQKDESIALLKQRSDIFVLEANECGLNYYPYTEGFFITLKFDDNKVRDEAHQKLMNEHIYTIKVNKGIRIGICAIPVSKIKGLAKKIHDIVLS